MDAQTSMRCDLTEPTRFHGVMDLMLDGETLEAGDVILTSQSLLFRPDPTGSGSPDIEVPLDAITHAQLSRLKTRLALYVGDAHCLVLGGTDAVRLLTALTGSAGNSCTPLMAASGRLGHGQVRELQPANPHTCPRPIRRGFGA
jgi:hypothetical protein